MKPPVACVVDLSSQDIKRMQPVRTGTSATSAGTETVFVIEYQYSQRCGGCRQWLRIASEDSILPKSGILAVKPDVIFYGVIDVLAKSGERCAAARVDALLAEMIQPYQHPTLSHHEEQGTGCGFQGRRNVGCHGIVLACLGHAKPQARCASLRTLH
jgi:hypothetical protein